MTNETTVKTWRERIGAGPDFPLHAPTDVERAMEAEISELRARVAELLHVTADLDFEPDEHHQVADMANVGRSLMDYIKARYPSYCWNESPAEIVGDLMNEAEEGLEILGGLIANIEQDGNYSKEATLTFLNQIKLSFASQQGIAQEGGAS